MPLDPKLQALLAMPGMQLAAPPPEITPPMMREHAKTLLPPVTPPAVHAVENIQVPGPAGALRVRLYRPSSAPGLPLVVFYHGGGFVLCDLDSHDVLCRTLANESGCVVASVEYRLAPEAKFPAPLEDCYAALVALVAQSVALGIDAERVAVCGDSAGGNLAAAVCLLARDRRGPAIQYQALFCPVIDAACDSASMHSLAEGYMLSRSIMHWFWQQYLAQASDGENPLASPLRAASLAGLPAATIVTAEFDPLRDEGEAYATRLLAADVPVVLRRYQGMIHDFVTMPLATHVAARGIADVANDLRAALGMSDARRMAIVQQFYQSMLAGDFATVRSLVTEDFVVTEAADLPYGGNWQGVAGLQALFGQVASLVTMRDVKLKRYFVNGDQAVVTIDLVIDDRGVPRTVEIMEIVYFRGDRIYKQQPYYFDAAQMHAASKPS